MSEYYAVIRSTDHLMHYGIRGMKWGVRKAVRSGDMRKLNRQYQKAMKKLQKLNDRTDIDKQAQKAEKHNKRALLSLGIGAAGAAVYTGNRMIASHLAKKFTKTEEPAFQLRQSARKKRIVGEGKGIAKQGEGLGTGPVGQNAGTTNPGIAGTGTKKKPNTFRTIHNVSGAVAAAGLASSAYHLGRQIAAERRMTQQGHAKAVAKRDQFRREMENTFNNAYNSMVYRKKKRR